MDTTDTRTTLDLMICGNPVILHTDYGSLDKAQKALQHALKRVNTELDYLENQPSRGEQHRWGCK